VPQSFSGDMIDIGDTRLLLWGGATARLCPPQMPPMGGFYSLFFV